MAFALSTVFGSPALQGKNEHRKTERKSERERVEAVRFIDRDFSIYMHNMNNCY